MLGQDEFLEHIDKCTHNEEITMEMIQEAMILIKEQNPEKIIFEDDYQTIWGNGLGPTKIKLKKKGTDAVEKLIFNGEEVFGAQFTGRSSK